MKHASAALALSAATCLAQAPGIASAAGAAPSLPAAASQFGCFPSASRPNFGTLPSGTRIYFMPTLTIRYPRPGVDVAEARFASEHGELRADIRDNAIYVNGRKTQVTVTEGAQISMESSLQVCAYPAGPSLPAFLTNLTPDLVLR